jgi:20S proteasome alpha/beta subunit
MIAGINGKKPELFASDITGNYLAYSANAIGENDEKIKEMLRAKYTPELTIKQGVKMALSIFEDIQGKKFDINRFELVYIKIREEKLQRIEGNQLKEFHD